MKKKLMWSLVSLAIALLTIVAVLSQTGNMSLLKLNEYLYGADPLYLILAVISMLGFIIFEGEAILVIIKSTGYPRNHWQGLIYGSSDIYFSAITPSASGGQPASAFFMMQHGIPISVVTAALLLNLLMYTASMLVIGAICIIIQPFTFLNFHLPGRIFIIVGYIIIAIFGEMFWLMLKKKKLLESIVVKTLKLLKKMHLVKRTDNKIVKIKKKMDNYADAARRMSGQGKTLLLAFLLNLLQRLSQLMVPVFMYLALHGDASKAPTIWVTQSLVTIGSSCMPIPGGMGIIDYLMLDGFGKLMTEEAAARLELLSRSLSFYICVLICGITTLIGYIQTLRRNKNDRIL